MNSAIPSWFSSIFFASQKKPLFLLRFCYWTNNIELLWISGVSVAESAENKSINWEWKFVAERPKGISYKFTLYYKKLICWREYYFEVQRLNFLMISRQSVNWYVVWWKKTRFSSWYWKTWDRTFVFYYNIRYKIFLENPFLFWKKEQKSTFLAYNLKF